MTTPRFILTSTRGGVNLIVEGDFFVGMGTKAGVGRVRRWWDATEWAVFLIASSGQQQEPRTSALAAAPFEPMSSLPTAHRCLAQRLAAPTEPGIAADRVLTPGSIAVVAVPKIGAANPLMFEANGLPGRRERSEAEAA